MGASNPGRDPVVERAPGSGQPTPTSTSAPRPPEPFPLKAVDTDALKVVRRLLGGGHEAYLVGGCVRDLWLGRRPKDFDVATSATPEQIRKLFRNSRIIGRRFKLAHVYFGPKVIETSTFRTTPSEQTSSSGDLLITHDNEWGTIEDDARRRDFTINALFYDVEERRVVDFVQGTRDLEKRIIRTIGDPRVRFKEDPVRMIRAIKFAARLDFSIEEQTWEALLDVAPDIVKCSQARLLEEIYKLLRGGAARRGFELMLESGLGEDIMPKYMERCRTEVSRTEGNGGSQVPQLLWRYLDALDDYHAQTSQVASNGVLQALLFAPLLGENIQDTRRQELDRRIDGLMTPVATNLGVARRDRELARQILMAHHRMMGAAAGRRRRTSLVNRDYFHDALIFFGVAVRAQQGDGSELERWQELAAHAKITAKRPEKRRRGNRRRRGGGKRKKRKRSGGGRSGNS